LGLIRRFEKGGSGSSGLEFKRPAADAASGWWQTGSRADDVDNVSEALRCTTAFTSR